MVRDERARLAASKFRTMQPTLSGFARVLTGRKNVRVVMSAGTPCTDGDTIKLRPPIELGDTTVAHEKRLCDERDSNSVPRCVACRFHEDVMITLYHEIAHIAFGSFEKVSDKQKAELVSKAVAEAGAADGSTRAGKIAERIANAPSRDRDSYIASARMVSPFLPGIVNALEDVRVNREMYRARPGTLPMFRGQANRVFTEGIQGDDGNYVKWCDLPPNAQAVVGMYAKAAGYDYSTWFAPEVVEHLNDPDLTALIDQMDEIDGIEGVYELAFPVLERLRALGYLKAPDDPEDDEPEPAPEGEPDDADAEGTAPPTPQEQDGTAQDDEPEGDDERDGSGAQPEQDDDDEPEGDDDDERDGSGSGATEDDDQGDGSDDDEPTEDDDDEPEDDDQGDDDADDDEPTEGDDDADDDEPTEGDDDADDDEPEGAESDDDSYDDEEYDEQDDDEPIDDHDLVERALAVFGGHDHDNEPESTDEQQDNAAVDTAIVQGEHFDRPSQRIRGVRIHKFGDLADTRATAWTRWNSHEYRRYVEAWAVDKTPESVLGPGLLRMRAAFHENRKRNSVRDLKSGKVDASVLGKRLPTGDTRLFHRQSRPGKRDYFVLIGMDISGSTSSGAIRELKAAVLAQAELCHRSGVKFAIYGHTGDYSSMGSGMDLDIYVIKDEMQAWDSKAKDALLTIGPHMCNLDGHTLEFYRKRCDESRATDKIIMYYTDGAMPAENGVEELEILQREIRTCKLHGITLLGVGVGTDSPIQHGLDTALMYGIEDVPKVVRHLEKRLSARR